MRCTLLSTTLLLTLLTLLLTGCSDNSQQGIEENPTPPSFGSAVDPALLTNAGYSETLRKYYNCLVAENHMKWAIVQPAEGNFSFTEADKIVNFARTYGMKMRGHALLWHLQVPDWVTAKPAADLDTVLKTHIDTVVGRYKGEIFAWDVANEIIMCADTGLRNRTLSASDPDYSPWSLNASDDSMIRKAFIYAHAADPEARLFLNDNNNYDGGELVYPGWNKLQSDLLYSFIRKWKEDGIPIHGVGMQLHLVEGYPPDYSLIEADIIRYGNLGLEIHFTEVDVRIKEPVTPQKLQNQAAIYRELARLAAKHPRTVRAFITWGLTDKHSWIPLFFTGFGHALPFDENYDPKECYQAIKETIAVPYRP